MPDFILAEVGERKKEVLLFENLNNGEIFFPPYFKNSTHTRHFQKFGKISIYKCNFTPYYFNFLNLNKLLG